MSWDALNGKPAFATGAGCGVSAASASRVGADGTTIAARDLAEGRVG